MNRPPGARNHAMMKAAQRAAFIVDARTRERRWLSCAVVVIATVVCAGQTPQPAAGSAPAAAVLADSEIHYTESGGIAGRVHEARFRATNGKVTVQYRAPDLPFPGGMQSGTVDNDAYVALWRAAESLNLWTLESARPSRGADFIQSELTLQQGTRKHDVRWDEESVSTVERLRAAAAWGKRALGVAREYAASR